MASLLSDFLVNASGGLAASLTFALLDSVGRAVKRQFQADPRRQALEAAMREGLIGALERAALPPEREQHYFEIFARAFSREDVLAELEQLVDPNPARRFDLGLLRTEFRAEGFTPEWLPDLDFDDTMRRFVGRFYSAAANQRELQDVLKIQALREVVEGVGALLSETERQTAILSRIEGLLARAQSPEKPGDAVRALDEVRTELSKLAERANAIDEQFRGYQARVEELEKRISGNTAVSSEELAERRTLFLKHVEAQFATIPLEALQRAGDDQVRVPLERVYVGLSAVTKVPERDLISGEERRLERKRREGRDRHDDEELRQAELRQDELERKRRMALERQPVSQILQDKDTRGLIILGEPGSGKTTLMQFMALCYARGPHAVREHFGIDGVDAERLPIFVPLAAYDDMLPRGSAQQAGQADDGINPVDLRDRMSFRYSLDELREVCFDLKVDYEDLSGDNKRARIMALIEHMRRRELLPALQARVLRDLPAETSADASYAFSHKAGIREFLDAYFAHRRGLAYAPSLIEDALSQGRGIVLLDGIDEVIDESRRRFVAAQIEAFAAEMMARGNRVIVTSRIYGYRTVPFTLPNAPVITVLDFRREEITRFASLYTQVLLELETGGGAVAQREADRERDALLSEVFARPRVEALAVNPLLLTMLTLLRRRQGGLPLRRIDLYQQYVEAMLTSWQHARSRGARADAVQAPDDLDALQRLLRELALWLHKDKPSGTARRYALLDWLKDYYLRREGLDPEKTRPVDEDRATARARAFLTWVREFSGLIVERGQDAFGFRHLTFQEYYVGWALASLPDSRRMAILNDKQRGETLHSNLWREVILLCAAKLGQQGRDGDAESFVRGILGAQSDHENMLHRDLFLAADCASEDMGASPALLRALVDDLHTLLDNRTPRIVASVVTCLGQIAAVQGIDELTAVRISQTLMSLVNNGRDVIYNAVREQLHVVRWSILLSGEASRLIIKDFIESGNTSHGVELQQQLTAKISILRSAVLDRIADVSKEVRRAAVTALGGQQEDVAVRTAILARLTDDDFEVRSAAVGALRGQLVDAQVRKAVVERLTDEQYAVSCLAISALGAWLDDVAVREAVLDRLSDENSYVRIAAVTALKAHMDDPVVCESVLKCLDDDDRDVRSAAVTALSERLDDIGTLTAIRDRLNDDDNKVRFAAISVLGSRLDDKVVREAILRRLTKDRFNVRLAAMSALSTHRSDVSVRAALLERLTDHDDAVRIAAVGALKTQLDDAAVRTALLERLTKDRYQVRVAAINALSAWLSLADVRQVILDRISDDDEDVRIAAISALRGKNSDVLSALPDNLDLSIKVRRSLASEFHGQLSKVPNRARIRQGLDCLEDQHKPSSSQVSCMAALATVLSCSNDNESGAIANRVAVRDAFLKRLASNQYKLRSAAVSALSGHLGDVAVRASFIQQLTSKLHDIRVAAMGALSGHVDDADVRAAILDRLGNDRYTIRAAAVRVLSVQLHNADVRAAILDRLNNDRYCVRVAAVNALSAQLDDVSVRVVILEQLADDDNNVRRAAVSALSAQLDDEAVCKAIREKLSDSSYDVRVAAVHALSSRLHDAATRSAILERLSDDDDDVRIATVEVLRAQLYDGAVRKALIERLSDDDANVRVAAVSTLGSRMDDSEVRVAITKRLTDGSDGVRGAVAMALSRYFEDAAVRSAILSWLRNERYNLSVVAVSAISAQLSDTEVRAVILERITDDYPQVRSVAIHALSNQLEDPAARAAVFARLSDDESYVRRAAVTALSAQLGDASVRAAVLRCLTDDESYVRRAAVTALSAQLDDPLVRAAVLRCLTDDDSYVSLAAVTALSAQLDDPLVRTAILLRVDDHRISMRSAAVTALGAQLDDPSVRVAILARLGDDASEVRKAAVIALSAQLDDPSVRAAILARLGDSVNDVRSAAVSAVAQASWISEFEPQIIAILDSPDDTLRTSAAEILSLLGADAIARAIPALLRALSDHRTLKSWPARLAFADVGINQEEDDIHGACVSTAIEALDYGLRPLTFAEDGPDVRSQAAEVLAKLDAAHRDDAVLQRLLQALEVEPSDGARDGLYAAILSLASAPEVEIAQA